MVLRVALAALLLVACGDNLNTPRVDPRCAPTLDGFPLRASVVPNECGYPCAADAGTGWAVCDRDGGNGTVIYVCTNRTTRENCGECGNRCATGLVCVNQRCVP